MKTKEIEKHLFELQDKKYKDFQIPLLPSVLPETIIGVRTPALRAFAKQIVKEEDFKDTEKFLQSLPHNYFDENQLHAFILCEEKDFELCAERIHSFLPYIDNWATCDQLSPKVFKKHHAELLPWIKKWIKSEHTYTVRFAVGMLMQHFLDEDFSERYLSEVSKIKSTEYYVNMMRAWYFATALAKQYKAALPFIEQKKLDSWTHNKAIQKSIESYRITTEQKKYLRTLKV